MTYILVLSPAYSFNMSLEFRSFHAEGIIFYIENLDQTQYVHVRLVDGKIRVKFAIQDDVKTLQSAVRVDDGRWHDVSWISLGCNDVKFHPLKFSSCYACVLFQVHLSRDQKSVKIRVNGEAPLSGDVSRNLDASASIFVGGLPKTFTPAVGVVSISCTPLQNLSMFNSWKRIFLVMLNSNE